MKAIGVLFGLILSAQIASADRWVDSVANECNSNADSDGFYYVVNSTQIGASLFNCTVSKKSLKDANYKQDVVTETLADDAALNPDYVWNGDKINIKKVGDLYDPSTEMHSGCEFSYQKATMNTHGQTDSVTSPMTIDMVCVVTAYCP